MKYLATIVSIILSSLIMSGQGLIGSWSDHLSCSHSNYLAAGDNKVFSSTESALLIYDLQYNDISKMSKASGLTETGISAIAWSDQEETLIIVYENTNVDLLKKGIITNIPDIKNKSLPGLKEIYNIIISGKYALLSGSFGIVVVDLNGRYIADTWKPGPDGDINAVYETTILDGTIYAATGKGVYSALFSGSGLSYYGNWDMMESLQAACYSKITTDGSSLFVARRNEDGAQDSLFRIVPGGAAQFLFARPETEIMSLDSYASGITASFTSSIAIFSPEGELTSEITSYGWGTPKPNNSITYKNMLWIADEANGLISASDLAEFKINTISSPYTNNVADIYIDNSRVFVTGGTVDNAWGNVYRPLQVFIKSGTDWTSNIIYGSADRDAMRVVTDPDDINHYYISSWGNGLYEFNNNTLINNYNQYNSPLSSIIAGEAHTRICGLAFDTRGNLWMTHTGVSGNLKVLYSDGTWGVTDVTLNVPAVGDMVIDDNNYIWALLPRGYGLLVYNPGNTPGDISDDSYLTMQIEDSEGTVINNLFSIARDNEGNIWVGTDKGPVVFYTPDRVFSSGATATRIKVPRDDGSGLADYLLSTETITTIAVDGANRKWFGTLSSGAYLVSDDGKTQLQCFNSENSPMLSDNITKIAIDGLTGEVWFGTSEGLITFRGDATAGKEDYSGMYVFPNPVREDYEGEVTITGLVEGSTVKITDLSGNLVFETTSAGGQARWDMTNYRGRRVNTGVYLIFCSNSDGSLAAVTKMLVMH